MVSVQYSGRSQTVVASPYVTSSQHDSRFSLGIPELDILLGSLVRWAGTRRARRPDLAARTVHGFPGSTQVHRITSCIGCIVSLIEAELLAKLRGCHHTL